MNPFYKICDSVGSFDIYGLIFIDFIYNNITYMEEKRKLFDDDLEFISSNPIVSSTYYLKPYNS